MKWRMKKKNPNSREEEIGIQKQENEPNSKKPYSSSNFSKILPFSSWLSKLKQFSKPNAIAAAELPITERSTAPFPKPLFSPPRLPQHPADVIPRRLSVGDDETHLARSRASQSLPRLSRHNSIGSELELRSDLDLLDPIQTNLHRRQRTVSPNPIRGGHRSSGGRTLPKVRIFSPKLANPVGLERYAVVKRSTDPARDFRESMAEMIGERGIGRPDELESLLACYLSLNSDEHHDVIIKVFRQVWFDFNRVLEVN